MKIKFFASQAVTTRSSSHCLQCKRLGHTWSRCDKLKLKLYGSLAVTTRWCSSCSQVKRSRQDEAQIFAKWSLNGLQGKQLRHKYARIVCTSSGILRKSSGYDKIKLEFFASQAVTTEAQMVCKVKPLRQDEAQMVCNASGYDKMMFKLFASQAAKTRWRSSSLETETLLTWWSSNSLQVK